MAYTRYKVAGRDLLNLDDLAMVPYDKYYVLLELSFQRRNNITLYYNILQRSSKVSNEPDISYSVLYERFLKKLKEENIDLYNEKMRIFSDYERDLYEEEKMFKAEKAKLMDEGYRFDKNLRNYGFYVFKVGNDYYQYKYVNKGLYTIDMGDKLLPMRAEISGYEVLPLSKSELFRIEMQVEKKQKMHNYRTIFNKKVRIFMCSERTIKVILNSNTSDDINKLNELLNPIRTSIYRLIKLRMGDYGRNKTDYNRAFNNLSYEAKDSLFKLFNDYNKIYKEIIKIYNREEQEKIENKEDLSSNKKRK